MSDQKPTGSARDPLFDSLKRLFDDLARDSVPQEFLDLLAKIDAQEAERKSGPTSGETK